MSSRASGGAQALRKIEIERASATTRVAPSETLAGRRVTLKASLRHSSPADLPFGSHTVPARLAGDSVYRPNVGRASLGVTHRAHAAASWRDAAPCHP
jgi:hypothetical protein